MSNSSAASTPGGPLLLPDLHFDNSLGALLVGGLVSFALYGVTFAQTYIYYERRHSDRPFIKILVFTLWILDTFDAALIGHLLYHYMVTNYINPSAMLSPVWSILIHVLVTTHQSPKSITDFIVRMMFSRRILKLSGSYVLTGVVVAISFVDLICGLIITGKAFGLSTYAELESISKLFYLNFAAGTAGDLYVALVLCYFLHSSRTGFKRTDSLINILIIYTVNTGLITALDAAAGMITYIVMPSNFIFIGFYLNLSRFYVNSYLASLNARDIIREKSSGNIVSIQLSRLTNSFRTHDIETGVTTPSSTTTMMPKRSASRNHAHLNEVNITVDTVVDRDCDKEQGCYAE
ncbi:hypothetical protein OE88DRAFT_1735895 [Heliocybe sulcata]|uniref:DUF6534 domain-containing protein n=1 Tax=Heliocybe sulcata TaxID=5364 RepID=A0A5C3MZH7_9AGAM|nr:hypothetical protein OE88DRAFT_1735895 [Heliocybe sulcata]